MYKRQELEPIGRSKYPIIDYFKRESHTLMLMDTILTGKYEGRDYPFKGLIMTAADPMFTEANTCLLYTSIQQENGIVH